MERQSIIILKMERLFGVISMKRIGILALLTILLLSYVIIGLVKNHSRTIGAITYIGVSK